MASTYTDDTSGMSSSKEEADCAWKELGEKFEIKDLGELKFVLGICVSHDRTRKTIMLNQEEYLKQTLERYGMADCMPKYTPLPPGVVLSQMQTPSTNKEHTYMQDKPYREALGLLVYAQVRTCPDIAYTITLLSRFASNPGRAHWLALLHVMQYIKATLHYKLWYGGDGYNNYIPQGFYDSYFAADIDTRKSISGGVYLQAGGPTCRSTKFQDTVSTSTTKSEYIVLGKAGKQMLWMYAALAEIGLGVPYPARLRGDNNGLIAIAENKQNHNRVKHIDV